MRKFEDEGPKEEDREKAGGSVAACPPLPSAGSSSSEPPAARTRDAACAPGWGSEAACPPCPGPQTQAGGGGGWTLVCDPDLSVRSVSCSTHRTHNEVGLTALSLLHYRLSLRVTPSLLSCFSARPYSTLLAYLTGGTCLVLLLG